MDHELSEGPPAVPEPTPLHAVPGKRAIPEVPVNSGKPAPSWLNLWTAAGGLAGAAVFVYGIGGALEAMRLNAAGVPVEQAMAVVPKATLFTLAMAALLLPTLAAAFATGLFALVINHWSDRATTPEKIAQWQARAEKKAASQSRSRLQPLMRAIGRLLERASNSRARLPLAYALALPIYSIAIGIKLVNAALPAWRMTLGRIRHKRWVVFSLLLVFVLPWRLNSLIFTVCMLGQLPLQSIVMDRKNSGRISRRREAILIGLIVAGAVGLHAIAEEAIRPANLAQARVAVAGQKPLLIGGFVAVTTEDVYVDVHGRLDAIPQRRVEEVLVSHPLPTKEENPRTLLDRVK